MTDDFKTAQSPHRNLDSRLEAAAREGELQADLVAAYLNDAGFVPDSSRRDKAATPSCLERVNRFLLELGASLRTRQLHESKLTMMLPVSLPSPDRALRMAGEAAEPGAKLDLTVTLLHLTQNFLLPTARPRLGIDVVLPHVEDDCRDPDDLIDRFVNFLWKHRKIVDEENGNEN